MNAAAFRVAQAVNRREIGPKRPDARAKLANAITEALLTGGRRERHLDAVELRALIREALAAWARR